MNRALTISPYWLLANLDTLACVHVDPANGQVVESRIAQAARPT